METLAMSDLPRTSPPRRVFLSAAALLAGCQSPPGTNRPRPLSAPIYVADAHSHYGVFRPSKIRDGVDLGPRLRAAGVTLLAWTPSSDGPWTRMGARRREQFAEPMPGQLEAHMFGALGRIRRMAERSNLPFVLLPEDVDRAARGESMIVMTAEGSDFLEGSLNGLARAYALGLRHLQLVHYIRNPVGDIQTQPPEHNGLSAFGRQLVEACTRRGILIDLAHSSRDTVDMALDATDAAPIWSHSVISATDEHWSQSGAQARRLHISTARKIAARGGAIGLWALGNSTGYRVDQYADSLLRAADQVGTAHVMIGTDTDGFSAKEAQSVAEPADLRRVVDALLERNIDESVVRAICFGNYARCLKAAMSRSLSEYRKG